MTGTDQIVSEMGSRFVRNSVRAFEVIWGVFLHQREPSQRQLSLTQFGGTKTGTYSRRKIQHSISSLSHAAMVSPISSRRIYQRRRIDGRRKPNRHRDGIHWHSSFQTLLDDILYVKTIHN
jgi:hypothetical protein